MIIGLQKEGFPVVMPNANMLISKDDIMWVVGANNYVGRLAAQYFEEEK